jgi:hypothetical protein
MPLPGDPGREYPQTSSAVRAFGHHTLANPDVRMQVAVDQLSYGPLNNVANMCFFTLMVESVPHLLISCAVPGLTQ